ncbi:hypothetical protein WA026_000583 [Henosepilachna vigintioctopunctata]|uniref:Myrosinase 1-like n=1 Tax=Henosepilachna vigintioctopunctata TaxID=420089 RepID=A0AAW1UY23_9CUCU
MVQFDSVLIFILFSSQVSAEVYNYSFPTNFAFGVASSAYQIEGAYNEDGRTDSIWDYNLHEKPSWVIDESNGDVACDSYHKWEEDVQLIKELGANFYRFSISWSRILPSAYKDTEVNEKGVAYYNNLINKLLDEGITPMVTIYHWDLPQSLQENGGWMNATIADNFVFYAKTLFQLFGDRVKHWITFNEPIEICEAGYSSDRKAPFLNAAGVGGYICSHNVLLSHGKTYREYEKLFKPTQRGQIGLSAASYWYEPKENSGLDAEASHRALLFSLGWYIHPLVKGNYPPIMIERIDEISKKEGFAESRLPKFTDSEIEMIRGSFDFIGLNHYTTVQGTFGTDFPEPSAYFDCGVKSSVDPEWEVAPTSSWLRNVPWGLRKLLVWIKNEYGNPPVLITENGWSSTATLDDTDRIRYINGYLLSVLQAIHEDGCNVLGYTHWSLLDNLEWLAGYSARFGLVDVDFNSSNKTRTPRKSYGVYQEIIKSRRINP